MDTYKSKRKAILSHLWTTDIYDSMTHRTTYYSGKAEQSSSNPPITFVEREKYKCCSTSVFKWIASKVDCMESWVGIMG